MSHPAKPFESYYDAAQYNIKAARQAWDKGEPTNVVQTTLLFGIANSLQGILSRLEDGS